MCRVVVVAPSSALRFDRSDPLRPSLIPIRGVSECARRRTCKRQGAPCRSLHSSAAKDVVQHGPRGAGEEQSDASRLRNGV